MYVITNSAMDFADGAQRFNWCACDNTKRKVATGLAGLGDDDLTPPTPLFDFSFWNSYLKGGGSPVAVPAAGSTSALAASVTSVSSSISGNIIPLALAGAVAYWLFKRK